MPTDFISWHLPIKLMPTAIYISEPIREVGLNGLKFLSRIKVLSALMVGKFTTLPIIRYDSNLTNNYTTPYIMYSYGTNQGSLRINVPYPWSGSTYCMQIVISKLRMSFRQWSGSAWSNYFIAEFTEDT
jgi:hypothetical protein